MKKNQAVSEIIPEEEISQIIETYLSTNKFQNSLNTLILATLSNKKNLLLSEEETCDKIINYEYMKDIENEILLNLKKKYNIENIDIANNKGNKKSLTQTNQIKQDANTLLNTEISQGEIGNHQKINQTINEILNCDNPNSLERLFGELAKTSSELLCQHSKINHILKVLKSYLTIQTNNENFHIPEVNELLLNFSKNSNFQVILESTAIYIDFVNTLVEKFYKSTFDITKFYKIFFNLKTLNEIISTFYGSTILLRRIKLDFVKEFVGKFFKLALQNYDDSNSVYIEFNESHIEFGLSTNYILLLFFCLDQDLCCFKILLRLQSFRQFISEKFEDFRHIPFIDYNNSINSFKKKYCFLWKHYSILEQVYNKEKVSRKFLLYCWFSIKLHFLGYVLRHRNLRIQYYEYYSGKNKNFNCENHFRNLIKFLLQILFFERFEKIEKNLLEEENIQKGKSIVMSKINIEAKTHLDYIDFEHAQKQRIIFLVREILCDFILYCEDSNCLTNKACFMREILKNNTYGKDAFLLNLLNDVKLALEENLYYLIPDSY